MSGHLGQQVAVERETDHRRVGGRLVASDGRTLPLRAVTITADTRGGLARVVLEQRFTNAFSEVLRVTYLAPSRPTARCPLCLRLQRPMIRDCVTYSVQHEGVKKQVRVRGCSSHQ